MQQVEFSSFLTGRNEENLLCEYRLDITSVSYPTRVSLDMHRVVKHQQNRKSLLSVWEMMLCKSYL